MRSLTNRTEIANPETQIKSYYQLIIIAESEKERVRKKEKWNLISKFAAVMKDVMM